MKTRKSILIILAIAFISVSLANPYERKHNRSVMDQPVMVEEWMTQPFATLIEEPLEVEDWMTRPFITN